MQEIWDRFLGWEDPLEKEMATHSQYSCLENPMDRGAWRATVHGVAGVRQDLVTKPLEFLENYWRILYQSRSRAGEQGGPERASPGLASGQAQGRGALHLLEEGR